MNRLAGFLLIFELISTVYCGELVVPYAPSSIEFSKYASTLRLSDLDDVISTSMGYTSQGSGWRGLSVINPFKLPSAAVILSIPNEGAPIEHKTPKYTLKDDTDVEDMYLQVTGAVGARALLPTYFKHIILNEAKNLSGSSLKDINHLNTEVEPDSLFLSDMLTLPLVVKELEEGSTANSNGQDFVLVEVNSLAPLVRAYGKLSPQVKEAIALLHSRLDLLEEALRHFYNDNVVIYKVTSGKIDDHSRTARSLLATDQEKELNLALEYSEDYPVIFNIVLFLGIILTLAIIAIVVSMVFMDPGRDSIIYRMTNPRMKKDQ